MRGSIIYSIAKRVYNIPVVKFFLKGFVHLYANHNRKVRNINLMQNGNRVLAEYDAAMNEAKIPYMVYAGTLLGAIREHGMLKHDFDIDTAVFIEHDYKKVRKVLENVGFKLKRWFEVDNSLKGREETYVKDGVDVDVFYIYEDNGQTYNCDFHPFDDSKDLYESMKVYGKVGIRKCNLPLSKDVIRAPFDDIEVNIPVNANEWLEARYGMNYMTPNPNYHDSGKEKNIYEWTDVTAVFKVNEE